MSRTPINPPILIKVKCRCAYNNKVATCPSHTFDYSTDTESYFTGENIKGPADHSKIDHDTTACKAKGSFLYPLLEIKYRAHQTDKVHAQIMDWIEAEYKHPNEKVEQLKAHGELTEHTKINLWGNKFYQQDPSIATICGALVVYGLTVDNIGVVSFHGTSIKTNDKNESDVNLTSPLKGAAAWMMNDMLQVLQFIIPGNHNADNIDIAIKKFCFIIYLSCSIYMSYHSKAAERQPKACRYFHNSSTDIAELICIKHEALYTPELETRLGEGF
ncbi:fatty acid synthase alpha subunit Lsd1, partial [Massospora cicadina]